MITFNINCHVVYKNGMSKNSELVRQYIESIIKIQDKKLARNNDDSRGTYTNADIKFKSTMLKSNLCNYADAYILAKGTIIITGYGDDDAARQLDERNEDVIFKNCASFSKCISRINGTDIDNAQDINIVMPMYNLIEYSDNYSKTSRSLWQYYKDDPNDNIVQSEYLNLK